MSDTACNGWKGYGTRASAYATWRVNLEIVDDYATSGDLRAMYSEKPDVRTLATHLQLYAEDIVCGEDYNEENIATQYAMAFLDDVNWDEIAENILKDWSDIDF